MDTADSILSHPLEELSQVWLEGSTHGGGWQDERVIWSSKDMPFLVTYSKVGCPALKRAMQEEPTCDWTVTGACCKCQCAPPANEVVESSQNMMAWWVALTDKTCHNSNAAGYGRNCTQQARCGVGRRDWVGWLCGV